MAAPSKGTEERREQRAGELDRLLRHERRWLLSQARLHSRTPEEAEEALGDACVAFMRAYEGNDEEYALRWMMLVVKRCAWAIAKRRSRRELRRVDGLDEAREPTLVDPAGSLEEITERGEETEGLIEAVEQLKDDERTALILLGLGCSYREIAELRGWTLTKVNRCIAEGRAKVRERMGEGES